MEIKNYAVQLQSNLRRDLQDFLHKQDNQIHPTKEADTQLKQNNKFLLQ